MRTESLLFPIVKTNNNSEKEGKHISSGDTNPWEKKKRESIILEVVRRTVAIFICDFFNSNNCPRSDIL